MTPARIELRHRGALTTIADIPWSSTIKARIVHLCVRRSMEAAESSGRGLKAAKRAANAMWMLPPTAPRTAREVFARANGVINPHEAEPSNNSLVPDILVRANNVINPHD
jgi:hypothetical protein